MTVVAVRTQAEFPEPMPVRVKDPTVPTNRWTPPLDIQGLMVVLSKAREWEPVDWDLVFDGLDVVLHGEEQVSHHAAGVASRRRASVAVPDYDEADELAQRFRGALMQLVNRGLRDQADEKYPDISTLIEQARALRSEELPADPWRAMGLVRRLGQVTLQLVERLDEVGLVTGLVEC
ncbi:DUF6415 family natural product biosynthesis protein [Streptomyces sp. H39-S7]|uniref:DUF6415 family natural product biosynthesis protein n=1 Tax=Streptomyces sp. H39-S7 TaxID=3004357 RepID=UPI0022AEBF68|nr:DUF6415 family natural product biosynthesis protein [Streptomyces sp. H39-S7]MCZ4118113.1 DUF6415 family natural product biosynthesis protein [Streptomyces sp. H39-S7]